MIVLRLAAEKGSLQSLAPLFKTRLEHFESPNIQYRRLLVHTGSSDLCAIICDMSRNAAGSTLRHLLCKQTTIGTPNDIAFHGRCMTP